MQSKIITEVKGFLILGAFVTIVQHGLILVNLKNVFSERLEYVENTLSVGFFY